MAGRIPDQFIDELLARTDIADVISSRLTLKKTGQNYSALCPFHNEKSPSFSVNPNKQFYYCFGCGAGGNAISFVMEHDHLDFVETIELLAKDVGLEVPREQGAPDRYEQNAELLDLLSKSATFYQQQLIKSPEKLRATEYLKNERGLSGQIAKVFGLGFAPSGWDNLLTHLGTNSETKEKLFHSGMLIEKNEQPGHYYDRFRDRIIFPIRDARGRVIAFGGRAFGDEKPKYLNSPETAVFHKSQELYGLYEAKQNSRTLDHLIIVEGYMDVIVLAQHGITNALATLGTSVNSQHIRKIFKLVDKVTLCFDGDKAGRAAAIRGLEAALPVMQDGKQIRFLFLPEGEDPDSLVRQQGQEAFLKKLDDSSSLTHVLFEYARSQVTLNDEEGEAQFTQNVIALIGQLPDITFKSVLLKQLAEHARIDIETLSTQLSQKQQEANRYRPQTPNSGQNQLQDASHYTQPQGTNTPYYQPVTKQKAVNLHTTTPALNKVEQALLCLLLHPHIAQDIEISDPVLRQPEIELQTLSSVWRFFKKNATKNVGHFLGHNTLGKNANAQQIQVIYALLNHPDAYTKSSISNAKQEVIDMIMEKEQNLGLNTAIARLKSKGNETINNPNDREETYRIMEEIRKKKR
ncbi:DNA primase [Marinomonas agarivorans]|nr:DNA primase [Marinomonas agarivorans]